MGSAVPEPAAVFPFNDEEAEEEDGVAPPAAEAGLAVPHMEHTVRTASLMTVHMVQVQVLGSSDFDSAAPAEPDICTRAAAPAMTAWLGSAVPHTEHVLALAGFRTVHCIKTSGT